MTLKEMGRTKKRKRSKVIKCDCCKCKMDLEDKIEKRNVIIEKCGDMI